MKTFHNFTSLNIMYIQGIGNSLALITEFRITVPSLKTSIIKKTPYAEIKNIKSIIKNFLKLEIGLSSVFRRLKSKNIDKKYWEKRTNSQNIYIAHCIIVMLYGLDLNLCTI